MKQRVRKTTSSPKHKKAQIFSLEEYSSLRNETVERISIMNNQASSAFGILLTTWGAGFTLLGILVSCQVSDKHYHSNKRSYHYIRRTSDRICKEHGLSVITPGKEKGKSYIEHRASQTGTSYKAKLKAAIDRLIPALPILKICCSACRGKAMKSSGASMCPAGHRIRSGLPG